MPILKDFRTTKEISLPTYPDSKLEIYDSLIVGEIAGIDFATHNQIEQIIDALPHFIKSWNFTDEAGVTLEITRENLNFLQLDDVKYLGEQIVEFNKEVKKKLSSSPS